MVEKILQKKGYKPKNSSRTHIMKPDATPDHLIYIYSYLYILYDIFILIVNDMYEQLIRIMDQRYIYFDDDIFTDLYAKKIYFA